MGVSSSVIVFAVIAFASTTADDLVVLITFQSLNMQNKNQSTTEMMKNMWFIACGQVLSYTIIVSLSLLGLLLGNFCPEDYVALIGFIPLFLGFKGLYDYFFDDDGEEVVDDKVKENPNKSDLEVALVSVNPMTTDSDPPVSPTLRRTHSNTAVRHHVVDEVIRRNSQDSTKGSQVGEPEEEEESNILSRNFDKLFTAIGLHPLVQKVAIAGLIVGADNVAVYISLFAKLKEISLVLVALMIFYMLLFLYIFMSYFLVISVPNVSIYIDKYASIGIPILLIALGLFILSESILYESMTD